MAVEERRQLAKIIATMPDFADHRGRSVMADMAGLSDVLSGFDFTGRPTIVAGDLVGRLQHHGEVRDGYHALGMLLDYLCNLGDMPPGNVEYMEGIIAKYRLVPR
jgi:hypothetical protein